MLGGSVRIKYKSSEEIRLQREACLAVAEILDEVCAAVAPGVSTRDLDQVAARGIKRLGVTSAFLGYYDYPAVLCTSVNEVVVHGIPRRDVVLEEGDIIGIDFGVFKHGFCGDSARTVCVGEVSPEARRLVDVTRTSLDLAIDQCVPGARLGDIGHAVQSHVEMNGYSVVRSFVGHGIGRAMHEDPPVPNYGRPGTGKRLKSGLVIAIEPMVNAGAPEVEVLDDKWTAVTKDRRLSAHFEHTIAITDDGPWVLSRPQSTPGNPAHDAAPGT
ncbi:MAG TPA: type I methionyl aminopeptidase [Kofleriaceae bacterium]|nr:type I methionyl aminopeptidase [Kofleriaceae bacterium]